MKEKIVNITLSENFAKKCRKHESDKIKLYAPDGKSFKQVSKKSIRINEILTGIFGLVCGATGMALLGWEFLPGAIMLWLLGLWMFVSGVRGDYITLFRI